MKVIINSPEKLGLALRAARRHGNVTLDSLAQMVGVSKQTATNVELGRAKLSTMLAFLQQVGVTVSVDIPEKAGVMLEKLEHRARQDKVLPVSEKAG